MMKTLHVGTVAIAVAGSIVASIIIVAVNIKCNALSSVFRSLLVKEDILKPISKKPKIEI
ncbi:hypothetical protein YC2023_021339 [Brassica napus]